MSSCKPEVLDLSSPALASRWRQWKTDWTYFFDANELEKKSDAVQVGHFFNCAGLAAQERYSHFEWENP